MRDQIHTTGRIRLERIWSRSKAKPVPDRRATRHSALAQLLFSASAGFQGFPGVRSLQLLFLKSTPINPPKTYTLSRSGPPTSSHHQSIHPPRSFLSTLTSSQPQPTSGGGYRLAFSQILSSMQPPIYNARPFRLSPSFLSQDLLPLPLLRTPS